MRYSISIPFCAAVVAFSQGVPGPSKHFILSHRLEGSNPVLYDELTSMDDNLSHLYNELRSMGYYSRPEMRTQKLSHSDLQAMDARIKRMKTENEKRFREILTTYGWPSRVLVGPTGVATCLKLLQSGSAALRKDCLPLVKAAWKTGDVFGEQLASLTDQILVEEGKAQRYGTMFQIQQDGHYVYYAIEDVSNLDLRRKEIGMIPFSDVEKNDHERPYFMGH